MAEEKVKPAFLMLIKELPEEGLRTYKESLLRQIEKSPLHPRHHVWLEAVGLIVAEANRRGFSV